MSPIEIRYDLALTLDKKKGQTLTSDLIKCYKFL